MNKEKARQKRLLISAILLSAVFLTGFSLLALVEKRDKTKKAPVPKTEAFTEEMITETQISDPYAAALTSEAQTESAQTATETWTEQNLERIRSLSAGELAAFGTIASDSIHHLFYASAVNDTVFARISGISYTENDNISISDLSYLKMLYYGFDGNTYIGEMIVNQKIESDVLSIFKTLYENQYPIEKMTLIDAYDANDELSMEDNNTSAFNYRTIAGSSRLSNHSYGMAIDLNPRYNPYVKTSSDGSVLCQPENGRPYADRSREFTYKIDENDLAYRLFTEAGFTWGGSWNSVKDYQHFEKQD